MKNRIVANLLSALFLALLASVAPIIGQAQAVNLQLQNDYTVGISTATPRYGVGDVNNDRLPDLVTLNKNNLSAAGPINVFLNNGAGGFGAPINVTDNTGLSPNLPVIRDFNNDGNMDLAIAADGLSTGINIRLGNGTGNFPTGTYIAERGSPAIVSADFSGDGNLDLAICNNVNELRVLNGNGAGGFGAAATFATANTCTDLTTADFNVDGKPDIAVAERLATAAQAVQVFLNNGAGGFGAPVNTTASGAYQMVTADFNRDCIPDLAATQFSGSTIYILIGNGAGGFASTSLTVTNSPAFMTVGDFNRDRKVDLAVRRNTLTAGANNLTIFPGNGAGGFGAAFEMSIAVPTSTVEMRLATIDANLDGKEDIVIGRQGGFFLYNGNSALSARTENDFDGDGKTDLSVFRPSNGTWYINRSTQGGFVQQWGLGSDKLAPADFDGDGKTDFAVWRENGFGDSNKSYFFILRSSNGTMQQEQFGRAGDNPSMVGDWDGDGKADVAVYRSGASAGAQSFFFYRPSATAGADFTTVYWGTSGDVPARGDYDGDGKIDAAVFRPTGGNWFVQRSGDQSLQVQQWGASSDKIVPKDYDGDGKTDFAVFRPTDSIWYILNSATNTPTYRQWGNNTDALTPGDYNGDGKAEAAVYRASGQNWYVPPCANFNINGAKFGASGDVAVPSSSLPQ